MKIRFEPLVALKLETLVNATRGQEFSGFGFVDLDKTNGTFIVYDIVLLDVGNVIYTEIPTKKILELMDRPDAPHMKLWFHRHPMGDGKPGPRNWSSTDEDTARRNPLGGVPELVQWALAIVRTPEGWVGRYDTFGPKGRTYHLEVEPDLWSICRGEVAAILAAKPVPEAPRLFEAFDARQYRPGIVRTSNASAAIGHEEDIYFEDESGTEVGEENDFLVYPKEDDDEDFGAGLITGWMLGGM
jgi:hypothetical protein